MKPVQVLLVEDNPGDILLMRHALVREPFPISIHVAVDGQQALQMLDNEYVEPDLIILDLNLPKIPGLLILDRCQVAAPVVVFSSSCNPDEENRALELGAKDFVQKSTDLATFKEQVSRIVRDWAGPETSGMTVH